MFRRTVLVASLLLVISGSAFPACRAAVVLDQQNIPPAPSGVTGFEQGDFVGQTFTVGISGTLDHINVSMRQSALDLSDHLTFDVRPTVNGVPVEDDALALVVGQAATDILPRIPPQNSFAWLTLDTSGAHIAVVPGEVLAVVIRTSTSEIGGFGWELGGAIPPAGYTAGQGFVRAAGHTAWQTVVNSDPYYDYEFQTFVNTPEPSTLILIALGGLVVPALRRRR